MYTGIRLLLLLICPFIFSFFFLSNFQTLKIFITLFSGTARPRRLKLGTVNSSLVRTVKKIFTDRSVRTIRNWPVIKIFSVQTI